MISIPFLNGGLMGDDVEQVGPTVLHRIAGMGLGILEGSTPLEQGPFPLNNRLGGVNRPVPIFAPGIPRNPSRPRQKAIQVFWKQRHLWRGGFKILVSALEGEG